MKKDLSYAAETHCLQTWGVCQYIPCYTINIGKEIAKYKTEKLFNDIINSLK